MSSSAAPLPTSHVRSRTIRALVWRALMRNRSAKVGAIVLAIVICASVFAPFVAPRDPIDVVGDRRIEAPSLEFPMGTDTLGRDNLSRVIYGGRISLRLGLISVGIAAVTGTGLGLVSGYYGGWTDNVIMRFVDILLAFPSILLALMIVYVLGPGTNNLMIAVGLSAMPGYARVVRGSVLSARELTYVEAARALGVGNRRIVLRHILPNVLSPVLVLSTLGMASAILAAAGLSFLGFGATPPTPEWGVMVNEGRPHLVQAWWMTTFPGLAMMITVLGFNLFGDGLRDALDPSLYAGR
ncbi:MAG: ABC transporter permease [Armatimonadetes bacterium]|nr:ABC transporter permease [Armatimonadota bacterium]